MAREGKRFELKPVDDEVAKPVPVIRLESDETLLKEKPIRLHAPMAELKVSKRLDIPSRDDVELRTHQPGIEALIESNAVNPDLVEEDWGSESALHRNIPWGWFVLIGLLLAGGVIWSLTRVQTSEIQAEKIRVTTKTVLLDDEKEEKEASKLIESIHRAAREFFNATTIDALARLARQPERVRPLMKIYYADKPVAGSRLSEFRVLQPITLENQANFWMASVELENHEKRNLLIEIMPSGESRIDWETLVCYQPMKWDDFAKTRPTGTSLDFRVYIEQDNFFSHEFADSTRWNCFRLTALNSEETLFGYANVNSEISKKINDLLQHNGGRRASLILRLGIPEGLQSRSGVMIEKLLSPRWLYIDPPDAGS